jgi:hypothetical protein
MYYYYDPKNGELISTTRQLADKMYRLNELQYQIAQLAIAGYSKTEIQAATNLVFILLGARLEQGVQ